MPTAPNYMQALSVGIAVAGEIAIAYETYAGAGAVTIPPVKTYLAGDHIEIDITIRKLPPP